MLKIGDFSKLSRISIQMLRHYDRIGLLTPAGTDRFSGYRYYDVSQLPAANQIRAMKEMGFGLKAIGELLANGDGPFTKALETHEEQLLQELTALQTKIQLTRNRLSTLRDPGTPGYHVTRKDIPAAPVMCCRGLLQGYEQEGRLWTQLFSEMERQKVRRSSPAMQIAVFHDQSFRDRNIDVEVQCTVEGRCRDGGGAFYAMREPVTAVTAVYQGDYTLLAEVNADIAKWISENGYMMHGPGFNIYHRSPGETDHPQHLVTEVCFPVKREMRA